MSELSLKIHSSERHAGKRATYHVYYRRNGKVYFDPSWLGTESEAGDAVSGMVKLCYPKSKVELVKVVRLAPANL